jgi:hypothetical protein
MKPIVIAGANANPGAPKDWDLAHLTAAGA